MVAGFDYAPLDPQFCNLSRPAQRALINRGIYSPKDLSRLTREEVAALHGMGPASMPALLEILRRHGLGFKAAAEAPERAAARSGNEVDEFLAALEHPNKPALERLRAIILSAHRSIQEEIKWNAPSFYTTEHFATFKLRPAQTIQLVLHTGAKKRTNARPIELTDPMGLVKWATEDRGLVTFADLEDIEVKEAALRRILESWITQLDD